MENGNILEFRQGAERTEGPFSGRMELGEVIDPGSELLRKAPPVSQKRDIEYVKGAVRSRKILHGIYTSVRQVDGIAVISLFWKTLRVVIAGDDFFAYTEMKDIADASPSDRAARYVQMAGRYSDRKGDAVIGFVPLEVVLDTDGVPYVVGSRKQAMDIKRNMYFFSKDRPGKVGSRAMGSIVTRNPGFLRVEAFGCETVIGRGSLSAYEYIRDLEKMDRFAVGNALEVAITDLHADPRTGQVKLKLSHASVELEEGVQETVSEAKIGERFSANVIAVTNDHYVLMLNGYRKRALVRKSAARSDIPLAVGDRVAFIADEVSPERDLLMGRCIRK